MRTIARAKELSGASNPALVLLESPRERRSASSGTRSAASCESGATGETAVRALLERVVRSLGSKTNWSALAREMDVPLGGRKTPPDHRSVRD